ncbi:FAD binding domain-containing protein [Pseudonocardia asaccharolytica]|uniref:Xanthine dehydrogenase n=1 Tax=Pseudonocardia asaccharolytica DSM 44247 = NBRC 16224 TaxID=1123024 RepID=A0A511CVG5_9PSEU|nr:xanthine dehydrogenase family protein subunit M [Pseudonocardia asaccharolytica]GEL16565.1 xanthine dehydrogenase [Pseudonocardia asaccharolytica DSM 44247 = NBRC 16224]
MELRAVETLDAALEVLSSEGDRCQVLAGGTDVMIQLARREIAPSVLLHIEKIAALRGVEGNGSARFGPLVTHRDLAKGVLGERFRALAESAATCGGLQTQVVGTIGGNICNASPAADTLPALLVHDAEVTLRSTAATRTLPLHEFIVGRRATTRRADELLTEITLVQPGEGSGDVYLKVGRRSAMEVAIVGLAMRLRFDGGGTVTEVRIALASVGPRPVRSVEAEAALVGGRLEPDAIDAAASAVLRDITPVDDVRGTAEYRRRVIPGLLHRAAAICTQRAGWTSPGGEG